MAETAVYAHVPRDLDDVPIQTLAPSTITNAAVGAASVVSALPSGAEIVEVAMDTDGYILFTTSGGSVSASTGQVFPKGVGVYRVPREATHVAHIRNTDSGRISITKLV